MERFTGLLGIIAILATAYFCSTDRKAIKRAISRTEGNISSAAKLLGISRPTLYDLLKQYDLHV